MNNETTRAMSYDLVESLDGKEFRFYRNKVLVCHGYLKDVIGTMVRTHGFDIDDIEFAVEMMLRDDHDRAHFGTYRTLIFTTNEPVNPSGFAAA